MENPQKSLKMNIILSVIVVMTVMVVTGTLFCSSTYAGEETAAGVNTDNEGNSNDKDGKNITPKTVNGNILYAAAIAFSVGALGAGIAISYVGSAAMGAIAEKPQIAGQAMIFVAMGEGIVVFGFITALVIIGKV